MPGPNFCAGSGKIVEFTKGLLLTRRHADRPGRTRAGSDLHKAVEVCVEVVEVLKTAG